MRSTPWPFPGNSASTPTSTGPRSSSTTPCGPPTAPTWNRWPPASASPPPSSSPTRRARSELPPEQPFCHDHHVRLDRAVVRAEAAAVECPRCGRANRQDARFCDQCGAPLTAAAPAGEAVTPDHLAEKIRRQRPSEGERRIVTVLFVDTVGSTPLAEKLGEEAMYSLMREALARMSDAVPHYQGYLATFTGDGLMALFGAPIAHEDSARRAVAAALRMQAALEEYGAAIEGRHGVGCRFRLGLNTGPGVV